MALLARLTEAAKQAHADREEQAVSAQARHTSWLRSEAVRVTAEIVDRSLSKQPLATEAEIRLIRAVGAILHERGLI